MKLKFNPVNPVKPMLKVEESLWNDWTWQMKNTLRSVDAFSKYFDLSQNEIDGFIGEKNKTFSVSCTPYYAAMALDENINGPIRQMIVPQAKELLDGMQALDDPLGEKNNNPAPRVIHRYPDRALFLVTDTCSVYCRYCTRKYFTGKQKAFVRSNEYKMALDYFKKNKKIREVILSGGDPLTLSDTRLENILCDLREIEHIEIIRIGSRMPVVCPMRITQGLVNIIKKYNPVYLMTHFNHPKEVTKEAAESLNLLADNGIPVFNQMVLLNGINNHEVIVQALSRRLLYLRVKPYYMFQCDPSFGTDHLRTRVEDSLKIQKNMWGHVSGLMMPNLSLDIPEGGGKTYLVPNFLVKHEGETRTYKGWDGVEASYINPSKASQKVPILDKQYQDEWDLLLS